MIKIALTNLRKYNEGELVYTWLELPANEYEIRAAFKKIGCLDGDEYIISDYEAPFEISESADVYELNEKLDELINIDATDSILAGVYDVYDVMHFAIDLANTGILSYAEEYVDCIISDETVRYNVQEMAKEGDFWRIRYFTNGITEPAAFYYVDGYGNCRDLRQSDLDDIVRELLDEVMR